MFANFSMELKSRWMGSHFAPYWQNVFRFNSPNWLTSNFPWAFFSSELIFFPELSVELPFRDFSSFCFW